VINTLLFDLDDTLLGNDMGTFLPAYFERLGAYFAQAAGSERLVPEMLSATQAMLANNDPERRLIDVFSDCFSPGTGWARADWEPRFDQFYAGGYRELQTVITARPAARQVIEWAFARRYQVAIATSPLFPLTAIHERLRWAGLDDLPFALVTSVDTSHFAKPRPEFYAEVLARLGRKPDQALMIGNDWDNDIVPAAALGMNTYWVTPAEAGAGATRPAASRGLDWVDARPIGQGPLQGLADTLAALTEEEQPSAPHGPGLPYLLSGNLAALMGELADWPAEKWSRRPAPGEWSLTEIVCHLRDVELEVNLPRLRAVIEQDNPFISGADTDPWALERDYAAQDGPRALHDFARARKASARLLRLQSPSIWTRTARHAIFGPTQLVEIAGWFLDHDLIHLEQVRTTKNSMGVSGYGTIQPMLDRGEKTTPTPPHPHTPTQS
jgi:FMN phosphatase YigB (HAD superfamily)